MANKMICTEAATKPHTIKFANPTLCTMAEAKARQKPATAPPNDRAQAMLPCAIHFHSCMGVMRSYTTANSTVINKAAPKYCKYKPYCANEKAITFPVGTLIKIYKNFWLL